MASSVARDWAPSASGGRVELRQLCTAPQPDNFMTHLTVTEGGTEQGEHVTDAEYQGDASSHDREQTRWSSEDELSLRSSAR